MCVYIYIYILIYIYIYTHTPGVHKGAAELSSASSFGSSQRGVLSLSLVIVMLLITSTINTEEMLLICTFKTEPDVLQVHKGDA